MLQLEYRAPPPELSQFVSAYYYFRSDEAFEDIERADVAQFRFVLDADSEGRLTFGDGRSALFGRVNVMGPRMRASRVSVSGSTCVFGVGILPSGWASFTERPAYQAADRLLPGHEILGHKMETILWDELKAASSFDEMVAISNARAISFYTERKAKLHWFVEIVDRWLEASLSPDVKALVTEVDLSARQVERLAKQLYGAPPKLLARKYRALRTANAIARGNVDWQDFVAEGYYDQSHYIREIKTFTGMTPSAIRNHASRLTALTFDRSQLMGKIQPLSALT